MAISRRAFHFQLVSIPMSGTPAGAPRVNCPQFNDDLHLVHTIVGRAVLLVGDHRYETSPRSVIAVPRSVRCMWNNFPGEPWQMINVHYRVTLADGAALEERYDLPISFRPPKLGAIHAQLKGIAADWQSGDALKKLGAATAMQSLIAGYWMRFGRPLESPVCGDPMIEEVCRLIRAEPTEAFDAEALAARAELSVSQLNRRFRAELNISPKAYWQQHRVAAVRTALRETDATLESLAPELGFRDVYYFCRWFRQQTGVTPGRYRAEARGMVI